MAKKIMNDTSTEGGSYQTICSKCDCHFSFSKIDTYPHRSEDIGGGNSTTNYVDCPQCHHSNPADLAMSPTKKDSGFMGMFSKGNIQQNILNDLNVAALRATKDDNEFKRLLIKQLGV
jgi:hypothetical protein